MNFEKLNTWLTFVANVGVVIGLIFLVVELRQSNDQAAAATALQRTSEIENQFRELALSSELVAIHVKFEQEGVDALTPVERAQLVNWESARIIRVAGQLDQYKRGYLDEAAYFGVLDLASRYMPLWQELMRSGQEFGPAVANIINSFEAEAAE